MLDRTDVAIIGAGQAGLAMSACLSRRGVEHLVLDRGGAGETWRAQGWEALRLLTPAWMMRLPGFAPPQGDPGRFLRAKEFLRHLEAYRAAIRAPLRAGAEVRALRRGGRGYVIETAAAAIDARAVVIATGACDRPAVPAWADALPAHVEQLTLARYRRAGLLPVGGVLVVGASATGVQLAAEIAASGRPVTLAAGRHVRAPRRYRGRDLFDWLDAAGFLSEPRAPGADPARLAQQPSLQLSGSGEELSLAALAARGVRIVGRALGAEGSAVVLGDGLAADCAAAEQRRRRLLSVIDAHIAAAGLPVATEPGAWRAPAPLPEAPGRLDLVAEGIRTVIWATGYRRAYPWLQVPVLGADGEIRQTGGVTPAPALYALGLPFMRHRASAFIDGVGRDAEALAPRIVRDLGLSHCLAA